MCSKVDVSISMYERGLRLLINLMVRNHFYSFWTELPMNLKIGTRRFFPICRQLPTQAASFSSHGRKMTYVCGRHFYRDPMGGMYTAIYDHCMMRYSGQCWCLSFRWRSSGSTQVQRQKSTSRLHMPFAIHFSFVLAAPIVHCHSVGSSQLVVAGS